MLLDIKLDRRAVACKHWRWVPGMAVADAYGVCGRILIVEDLKYCVANRVGSSWLSAAELARCLPDLTDPATLGCLLALVREAHGAPHAVAYWIWEFDDQHPTKLREMGRLPRRMWEVEDLTDWEDTPATSEAAALVAALEAADAA